MDSGPVESSDKECGEVQESKVVVKLSCDFIAFTVLVLEAASHNRKGRDSWT